MRRVLRGMEEEEEVRGGRVHVPGTLLLRDAGPRVLLLRCELRLSKSRAAAKPNSKLAKKGNLEARRPLGSHRSRTRKGFCYKAERVHLFDTHLPF